MSQVRNSMETKLGQSFQLLEVANKSKRLHKYIHANEFAIYCDACTEGYIPVVISSKAIMHE